MQKLWIEIFNPTENDKGKYNLEMFDGQETHHRSLDLSGQGAVVYIYTSCLTQTGHPAGNYTVIKGEEVSLCQYLADTMNHSCITDSL